MPPTVKPAEFHQFFFKDLAVAGEMFGLIRDRIISSNEFILFHVIDALVKPDATGCYATNAYLARAIGIRSTIKTSEYISRLVKLGLVRRVFSDQAGISGRYLWANKSRFTDWRSGKRRSPIARNRQPPLASQTQPEPAYSGLPNLGKGGLPKLGKHNLSSIKEEEYSLADARSTTPGEPMPFLPDLVTNSTTQQGKAGKHKPYRELAGEMRDALLAASRLTRVPGSKTMDKWAVELGRLAGNVGKARTRKAVRWVCRNAKRMGRPGSTLPNVTSPEVLKRDKVFTWIEDLITKDIKSRPPEDIPPKTLKLIDRIRSSYSWPKNCKDQLPGVICTSLASVRSFSKSLDSLDLKPKVDKARVKANLPDLRSQYAASPFKDVRKLAELPDSKLLKHCVREFRNVSADKDRRLIHTLHAGIGQHRTFVERWFGHVNKKVLNWKEWSGDLKYFTFRPDHPDFVKLMADVVSADDLNRIKELL